MNNIFRRSKRPSKNDTTLQANLPEVRSLAPDSVSELDIPHDDPLYQYFVSSPGVVEVEKLEFRSHIVDALKEAGVRITVPLVSQGELIGLLNIGPRRSEQDYSTDDHRLLNNLSTQAAPALRVAQLARQQQIEARERERMENELRVARIIQQTLLPKELPEKSGWQLAAHWQPARAVSGDFYDFIEFPDGSLGIVIADVTDKGVPAALVMATTRTILRAAAERLESPGKVLERANDLLCPDIPHNMFVTCLYAVLNPVTGEFCYANGGHNLPYKRTSDGVIELRATGMPLGLLPGMVYEENFDLIQVEESVILYSDGLIEAHNPSGEMFSFPKLRSVMESNPGGAELISILMHELGTFTGPEWEQEDDVTFVTLERLSEGELAPPAEVQVPSFWEAGDVLAEFSLPSQPGVERQAMLMVADALQDLNLPAEKLERIKTAVAETALNAMEHGNQYNPELPARIKVIKNPQVLAIYITDQGGSRPINQVIPDLEAKLAGLQSPRGWGLFLIQNMVDRMEIQTDEQHHIVKLVFSM